MKPNKGIINGWESLRVRIRHKNWFRTVNYRRVRVIKDTWLSVTTKHLGWDYFYSRDKGYGAYNPSIVVPFSKNDDPTYYKWGYARRDFDPDVTEPGDIVLVRPPPEPPKSTYKMPPRHISGRYNTTFEIKSRVGAGVGIPPVAGQVFSLQIRDPFRKKTREYIYSGAGTGGGISIVSPGEWTRVNVEPKRRGERLRLPIDVDDFEGNGVVVSLGIGRTGACFIFDNINGRMVVKGWDIQFGGEADVLGYWNRLDWFEE